VGLGQTALQGGKQLAVFIQRKYAHSAPILLQALLTLRVRALTVDIEGEEDNVDEALLYTFRNQEYPTETNGVAVTKVHRSLFSSACAFA